ncbi:hypothetical protein FORC58_0764 [Salmonella enterica subsp. enterica serovar Typhimurium]|nr:hypothetical protein SPC_3182 [Salmonella enterica subsp. enterica serovar Paratyphi C str. RKS4594]AVU69716.1 hypothetical protein FORC58_0764 [Salmonella enterica subsp. enterica serovar Typhimurium]
MFIPASPMLAGEISRNHGTFHQTAQGKISLYTSQIIKLLTA